MHCTAPVPPAVRCTKALGYLVAVIPAAVSAATLAAARGAFPDRRIIVVTESGMLHRLRREVPDKTFIAGPTDTCACNDCRYMKLNTIEKLRDALRNLAPEITLSAETIARAKEPILRMLEWSR